MRLDNIAKLKYLDREICRSLSDISRGRVRLTESIMSDLKSDMIEFVSGVEILRRYCVRENLTESMGDVICEFKTRSMLFEDTFKGLSTHRLNETVKYGFFNPFDDDTTESLPSVEVKPVAKDAKYIKGISLWNSNRKPKVEVSQNRVVSNTYFCTGDTIEVAPVLPLNRTSLYSKEIRERAFEIDPNRRLYGLGLGNASFYRNSVDSRKEANSDYEIIFKDGSPFIKIYATEKISKGDEIILYSDDTDFANAVHDNDFVYPDRSYTVVKDVRLA